jgi:hypothetical protein
MPAADLNEWAAAISFGTASYAVLSVPVFLLADADPADFDPRPALRRAIKSGRFDPALIAVTNARHTTQAAADRARHIPRDAALTAAALLALTFPTGDHR